MKKIYKNKGITLIALIITIIVLLILAGITIGALTSNNSILKQAGKAKNNTKVGKEKEVIELSVMGAVSLNKDALLKESEFQEQLNKNADEGNPIIIESNEEEYIVKFEDEDGKRYYNVPNDGDVEYIDGVTSEKVLTLQCVNSKNTVIKEYKYTIVTNNYSKNPPALEGYQVADNSKLEGEITESKTIKVLYYLLLQDDSSLVFTGLDSSGSVTTDESQIVSYMVGTGNGAAFNAIKNRGDENIKSILNIPDVYKGKPVVRVPKLAFGAYAGGCKFIKINLPENLKEVADSGFLNCNEFEELTLKKNVTYLGWDAFSGCTKLKKLILKNSMNSYNAAFGSTALEEIEIDPNSSAYYLEENKKVLYSKNKKTLIMCLLKDISEYTIPSCVTTVAPCAFAYSKIDKIITGENVTAVNSNGFRSAKSKEIIITDNVTSVGGVQLCYTCNNLEKITIGQGISVMGVNALFAGCSKLKTVVLRSSQIANGITAQGSYGGIVNYAETIYIKEDITTIGSYITENFSVTTSDREGYVKYVKNT